MTAPEATLLKPLRQLAIASGASVTLVTVIVGSATSGLLPEFGGQLLAALLGHVLSLLLMAAFLTGVYALIPYERLPWRTVWGPALLSAALYEVGKSVFVLYLENVSSLRLVYGSVTSVVVLLLWLYFWGRILLFGAELVTVKRREDPPLS